MKQIRVIILLLVLLLPVLSLKTGSESEAFSGSKGLAKDPTNMSDKVEFNRFLGQNPKLQAGVSQYLQVSKEAHKGLIGNACLISVDRETNKVFNEMTQSMNAPLTAADAEKWTAYFIKGTAELQKCAEKARKNRPVHHPHPKTAENPTPSKKPTMNIISATDLSAALRDNQLLSQEFDKFMLLSKTLKGRYKGNWCLGEVTNRVKSKLNSMLSERQESSVMSQLLKGGMKELEACVTF